MEANTTILDALADAAIRTVAKYEQHLDNGRHNDAAACLGAVETITAQVQQIEFNDKREAATFGTVKVNT